MMTETDRGDDTETTTVYAGRQHYELVVPQRDSDYIQGQIASTNRPYEEAMLAVMAQRLQPGDTVLDLGANIGNHTLYLACVAQCTVIAFEPDATLAEAIRRSAELNGVADRVRVEAVAVGAEPGRAWLASEDPANLGAQHLIPPDGDHQGRRVVDVVTLDSTIDEPVVAIKIDIEGAELDAVRGASRLLQEHHPDLYIECLTFSAFEQIDDLLTEWSYVYHSTYNASPTILFVARDKPIDDDVRSSIRKAVERSYEARVDHLATRQALQEANARYRTSTEQVGALRVTADRQRSEREDLLANLAYARAEVERLRRRESGMRADMRTLREFVAERENAQAVQQVNADERARREEAEQALRKIRASAGYRLGRSLANARTLRGALRLPKELGRLWKSMRRK